MKILVIFVFISITLTAHAICVDDGMSDPTGTDRIDELYVDAIPLSGPPSNLTAQEQSLWPYLDELLGSARGDEAAKKVMSHFDENNDGNLDKEELDRGFSKPPFEFGRIGRSIGIPVLLNTYGNNGLINIHGAKTFVKRYGF